MDYNSQRHITMTSSEVFELSSTELMTVDGGRGLPPITGLHTPKIDPAGDTVTVVVDGTVWHVFRSTAETMKRLDDLGMI